MDVLKEMRDTHGPRFTNRVNVDLHSGGGWSPEYWAQAAVRRILPSCSLYEITRHSLSGHKQLMPETTVQLIRLSLDLHHRAQLEPRRPHPRHLRRPDARRIGHTRRHAMHPARVGRDGVDRACKRMGAGIGHDGELERGESRAERGGVGEAE